MYAKEFLHKFLAHPLPFILHHLPSDGNKHSTIDLEHVRLLNELRFASFISFVQLHRDVVPLLFGVLDDIAPDPPDNRASSSS